jgi:hypothetical protein
MGRPATRLSYNLAINSDILYRRFPDGSVAQSVEQPRKLSGLVPIEYFDK